MEHKTRQKVSFVTGWKVERVGSRAQVILDGRAECAQGQLVIGKNKVKLSELILTRI